METLAFILFYVFLIGIIVGIVCFFVSLFKRNFRFSKKQILISIGICVIGFIASTLFYGAVQSPEKKAEIQKQIEEEKALKEKEKEEKEKIEAEKKAEEEKLKADEKAKEEQKKILEEQEKEKVKIEQENKKEAEKEKSIQEENAKKEAERKAEEDKKAEADAKAKEENLKGTLISLAQTTVENNLKNPKSADFPWSFDKYVIAKCDSTTEELNGYVVTGYVDATNSFNAVIRSDFAVQIELSENLEKYKIIDCSIQSR